MRALFLMAGAAALHACDVPPDVCYSCLEGDPQQPVPAEEIAKIGLLPNASKLPADASNIYYAEACGIDCQQEARFDLPMEGALEQISELGGVQTDRFEAAYLSQAPFDPWLDHAWFVPPSEGNARMFVSTMEDGPWLLTILAVEQDGAVRVYWQAGTM